MRAKNPHDRSAMDDRSPNGALVDVSASTLVDGNDPDGSSLRGCDSIVCPGPPGSAAAFLEKAMAFIPTLYTPRLTLRPFAQADAPRVRELAGDERVAATTAHIPHPYPCGLAEDWIRSHGHLAQDGKQYHFAITLAGTRTPGRENDWFDTGHLIGAVSLMLAGDPAQGWAELGYWIGVPYWNRGFATEAAHAVLALGFERKGLRRVVARHGVNNPASGRVLTSLGMSHESTMVEQFSKNDQLMDMECYALTREDWLRTRARYRFPLTQAELQPA
jgi:[ribosomal protein S5]-alanine N-acetyltransferase